MEVLVLYSRRHRGHGVLLNAKHDLVNVSLDSAEAAGNRKGAGNVACVGAELGTGIHEDDVALGE